MLRDGGRDLWSEVKRIRDNKSGCSNVVDNCCSDSGIADYFYEKYQDLYTSIPYNIADIDSIRSEVNGLIQGCTSDCIITSSDVVKAVDRLKFKKDDGNKGLSSDHIKWSSTDLFVHLALLLTGMLIHGFVPDDFLVSTIIPIPKGKNTNVTDSANYRGIALSSVMGKIIDLIVLERYCDNLLT
jgi:hypothetical protein